MSAHNLVQPSHPIFRARFRSRALRANRACERATNLIRAALSRRHGVRDLSAARTKKPIALLYLRAVSLQTMQAQRCNIGCLTGALADFGRVLSTRESTLHCQTLESE